MKSLKSFLIFLESQAGWHLKLNVTHWWFKADYPTRGDFSLIFHTFIIATCCLFFFLRFSFLKWTMVTAAMKLKDAYSLEGKL